MKPGIKGVPKCGCEDLVWGISIDAPNFLSKWHFNPPFGAINAGDCQLFPYQEHSTYPVTLPSDNSEVNATYDLKPEAWPRQADRVWEIYAAKVPTSYPNSACGYQPISSKETDDDESKWSVKISNVGKCWYSVIDDLEYNIITNWKYCLGSRAIYEDGKQTHIAYRYTAVQETSDADGFPFVGLIDSEIPNSCLIGDHVIINIQDQEKIGTGNIDQVYQAQFAKDYLYFANEFHSLTTVMENNLPRFYFPNTFNPTSPDNGQHAAATNFCMGKDYFVGSTYHADTNVNEWQVMRVKYEGTRDGTTGEMEVFSSPQSVSGVDGHVYGDLGTEGTVYAGDYVIMLPAIRTYIDTSVEGIDEAWVVARTFETYPKLLTSRWHSKVYRPGIGSEDEWTGEADGTLSADEVTAGNLILDTGSPPAGFEAETWNDLRVRCYNRVYDPTTDHSIDLLIFTTQAEESTAETATPTADFEDGTMVLPDTDGAIEFISTSNISGNAWVPDGTNPIGGTFSLHCNNNLYIQGTTNVSITVTVMENGSTMSFDWLLDNRAYPTNNPDPDNKLEFLMDDVVLATRDNLFGTHPDDYLAENVVVNDIPAGTHTFTWRLHRTDTTQDPRLDLLVAKLDNIVFPEIMIGDDAEGRKQFFAVKRHEQPARIYRAKYWAWAKRNEEGTVTPGVPDPLTARVKTTPDFITMDWEGRLLMGNPHWVARILLDENDDDSLDHSFGGPPQDAGPGAGYVRFTASPNIIQPIYPCYWDLPNPEPVDNVDDPKCGAFQILCGSDRYQIRGANAHVRDQTNDPIDRESFTFEDPPGTGYFKKEEFRDLLSSKGWWSQRPSCWTISGDGRTRIIPHLEVIWRITRDQPAWPAAPPYTSPPYPSGFEDSTHLSTWAHRSGGIRFRNAFNVPNDSILPRWPVTNTVIARSYCDAWSRIPQSVWIRKNWTIPLPHDIGNPAYWDPSWPPGGGGYGPWGGAKWELTVLRYNPCGSLWYGWEHIDLAASGLVPNSCDEPPEPIESAIPSLEFPAGNPITYSRMFWVFTDFDIVDQPCAGCA